MGLSKSNYHRAHPFALPRPISIKGLDRRVRPREAGGFCAVQVV